MIPEILISGTTYSISKWEKERSLELLRLFEQHVYGITPKIMPDRCEATIQEEQLLANTEVKRQVIHFEIEKNGKCCGFNSRIFIPKGQEHPYPVIIMINPFSKNKEVYYPGRDYDHMPYDILTEQGYIAVHTDVDELCLDNPEGYQKGLMELYPPEGESSWGAIGGWAWSVSRLIDYLVTRKDVDASFISICGCSRAGKIALWCGAQDPRVSLVISNVSGCSGAAVTRGKRGESIKDITATFPHWFCKKYATYAGREEMLPVDQHMLLALCAPRPVYISSASEDDWADPQKEFESCVLAEPVFKLYGRTGLGTDVFPEVDSPIFGESMGYHNREGIHGCRVYDWEQFLLFMKQYIDKRNDAI